MQTLREGLSRGLGMLLGSRWHWGGWDGVSLGRCSLLGAARGRRGEGGTGGASLSPSEAHCRER